MYFAFHLKVALIDARCREKEEILERNRRRKVKNSRTDIGKICARDGTFTKQNVCLRYKFKKRRIELASQPQVICIFFEIPRHLQEGNSSASADFRVAVSHSDTRQQNCSPQHVLLEVLVAVQADTAAEGATGGGGPPPSGRGRPRAPAGPRGRQVRGGRARGPQDAAPRGRRRLVRPTGPPPRFELFSPGTEVFLVLLQR